jgi:hypothetical protein
MNFPSRPTQAFYGSAVFLGAFLLFAVEPMAAKRLLPALGGSSAVWITCLVYFQTVLLLGYLYAHWIARLSGRRGATVAHMGLLVCAAALLLLVRQPDLAHAAEHPVTAIFAALTLSIGLPFLLLASTSPLLQVWFARQHQTTIPWRLFALSNAGSLLALVLYPTAIEPHLTLSAQRAAWGCGFGVYAILCVLIASRAGRVPAATQPESPAGESAAHSSRRARLLWFLLPAAGAIQLCAVTEHISQNIAAIPLLWVLPLAVYLLTFIIAFEAPRLYRPFIVVRLLVVLLAALAWFLTKTGVTLPILLTIGFFLTEMFLACLFCHGETWRLRPADPAESTVFYLLIAAGGAAGSVFIGILCPLLFDANYDIALAFLATAAVALISTWPEGWQTQLLWVSSTIVMLVVVVMLHLADARCMLEERNFYGTLRVTQTRAPDALTIRTLTHGTITHGTQWFAAEYRRMPTTYYARDSGVGLALRFCCQGAGGRPRPRNMGVAGLGAGTLAAYGQPGDRITFYEINPAVLPIAQHLFTYLRDSAARIEVVPGDARLSLAAQPPQNYDVLVIDAFSGDAIPVHLLTTQAVEVYRRQLAPGGILAFHVSNQFLDLAPEVAELAAAAGFQARIVDNPPIPELGEFRSTWVLLTDHAAFFGQPDIARAARMIPRKPGMRAWTDDFSSLLPIVQWKPLNQQ